MKLAIISDIHDNLANLDKCLSWCEAKGIETMLCCGDITTLETLAYLLKKFSGLVYMVLGNVDIFTEKETEGMSGLRNLGRKGGVIKLGGKTIGMCHEPDLMDGLTDKEDCDIIFYGHTHQPWIEKEGETMLVNPGTLGGMFSKSTFAVWDTEKAEPELKIQEIM